MLTLSFNKGENRVKKQVVITKKNYNFRTRLR